jgi:hypothetical protein
MFIPDPGSVFFPSRILDPNFSIPDPGSRIHIKEFTYFNPKKRFLSSRKYDPDFLPILDPGVKKAPETGSRIRIRNTAYYPETV